jgi:hypothetical protein
MRGSYPAYGFGGTNIDGLWQAVDELRSRFEKRAGTRAGKGEVRAAVLALLAERPMLRADEGVISAEESNGRKIYTLTEAGREEVARDHSSAPWDAAGPHAGAEFMSLPKAGVELAQAAAQVGRTGSPEQVKQAVAVLEEARRRMYSILAQD